MWCGFFFSSQFNRDLPLPPPIHPLPTPWFAPNLTNPPRLPCQNKTTWYAIWCRGKTFIFAHPRYLYIYTKPTTPCCKFGGKSLPKASSVLWTMLLLKFRTTSAEQFDQFCCDCYGCLVWKWSGIRPFGEVVLYHQQIPVVIGGHWYFQTWSIHVCTYT